jgi:hypothetical protein
MRESFLNIRSYAAYSSDWSWLTALRSWSGPPNLPMISFMFTICSFGFSLWLSIFYGSVITLFITLISGLLPSPGFALLPNSLPN